MKLTGARRMNDSVVTFPNVSGATIDEPSGILPCAFDCHECRPRGRIAMTSDHIPKIVRLCPSAYACARMTRVREPSHAMTTKVGAERRECSEKTFTQRTDEGICPRMGGNLVRILGEDVAEFARLRHRLKQNKCTIFKPTIPVWNP